MAKISCGSCKKSHSTVNEVKLCFTQNNNFVAEETITAPAVKVNKTKAPAAKVVKKAATPVAKSYKVETFTNKEDAEKFIKNNPNSKLNDTVKVSRVNTWNKDTESYQMVVTKTYTVVVY
jgi:hypothetical protein